MNGMITIVDHTTTESGSGLGLAVPGMRTGAPADAPAVLSLIDANRAAGHLLPRTLEDLRRNAERFVVLEHDGSIVGCAELAPLSRAVAEVRSLVVDEAWRGNGLATRLIEEVQRRATSADFSVLCAFAHDPDRFVRLGFSIVPHVWFPEKVALDCAPCPKFRTCGQYGLALALTDAGAIPTLRRLREPLASASTVEARAAALRPVRLRVIA